MHFIRHIRGWRSIDGGSFRVELLSNPSITYLAAIAVFTASDMFAGYEAVKEELVNNLIPSRPSRLRRCPLSPWFEAKC